MADQSSLPNFDSLWNYSNPAETERKFRDILPQAKLSQDAEYHAQLLTQIARCQGLQGHFEASHSTLDEVEKMLTLHDLKLARVRYLLERGRAFNSSKRALEAMPLFESAFEIGESLGEMRYAIDAVHMIAIAERDPRKQIEWNLKGIALAESSPNQSGWLNALLNNIGESYLLVEDYTNAAASFHRLADIQRERRGAPDMFTVKDEAKALRLGGYPEGSRALVQPIFEKLFSEGIDDGYIRQELAEALYALGRVEEARPHFAKGYEILSQDSWAMENEREKVERMKSLGEP